MRSRSKYGNVKTNGYASKKESKRGQELKLLEKAGRISNLREQVKFELIPKQGNERAVHYVADFTYDVGVVGSLSNPIRMVVEDAKGYRTPLYILKRKLMLWVHGIRIVEIEAASGRKARSGRKVKAQ